MLRTTIGIAGALCGIAGLLLLLSPQHNGLFLLIFGLLILLSLVFEGRYRAAKEPTGSWEPTGEEFIDPATGKLVEVDYDPQTGERNYRE